MKENSTLEIADFIEAWPVSVFANWSTSPWGILQTLPIILEGFLDQLSEDYRRVDDIAIHRSAMIEERVIIKGPAIIGPDCFIAHGAYLRGGVYLDRNCIIGPNVELKTIIMFHNSKLAHLNFAGDSIIGSDVNVEAGAVIANYRNELMLKLIRIEKDSIIYETDVEKFGALVGDGACIGANAVIAPGALIDQRQVIERSSVVDQYPL